MTFEYLKQQYQEMQGRRPRVGVVRNGTYNDRDIKELCNFIESLEMLIRLFILVGNENQSKPRKSSKLHRNLLYIL
ncbi:MAG: hypothetical protein ACXABY_13870 [Candidatus Thorarchaeota archaeon]|jgi:hypothetical protein